MDGIRCVLLDIEGTVCPISFVHDTLFPYAINALPAVLSTQWDDPTFRPYRDAFPEQHRTSPEALQAHVEDLTKRDVKVAYLKNLQGYLWHDGYRTAAYATALFEDVVPQLRQWKEDGLLSLAIYSSGSVFAQKLLFGHVQSTETTAATATKRARPIGDTEVQADDDAAGTKPPITMHAVETSGDDASDVKPRAASQSVATTPATSGDAGKAPDAAKTSSANDEQPPGTDDLTPLFDGWFDTTNAGMKTEPASYANIARDLEWKPEQMLFLSDNVKEIDAAHEAKMQAVLVHRPGNAEIAFADRSRLQVVESLSEIYFNKGTGTEVGKA
ncbi:hypothetical protein BST61_g1011 [Cercospora zeina]